MDDFRFFFDALALVEQAHGAIANTFVLRFYQSDASKQLQLLVIQEDLEYMLDELR